MADPNDILTFVPLYADQTEDAILDRWRGWANEGLDPSDVDQWTDVREGSMWWVHTTPGRQEAARIWDSMGTEVVAATFPQWSWGAYLDALAEARDVTRLPATPADGTVTFEGDAGTVIPPGTVVSTEPPDPDTAAIEFETNAIAVIPAGPPDPGTVDAAVTAREEGSASNVGAGSITALPSPPAGVISVTNADPTEGGTDEETDAALKVRLLATFAGSAVANIAYYARIALAEPGVGRVKVLNAGAGQILIIVATAAGAPVSGAVLASLQAKLDPIPGQGAGSGQVGATITVTTAATLLIDIAATIEFEDGYSLDPTSGLVDRRGQILAAIAAYLGVLQPGGEVVLQQVAGRIIGVTGVHDLAGLTLNGGTVNVPISAGPPKVAALGDTSGLVQGTV